MSLLAPHLSPSLIFLVNTKGFHKGPGICFLIFLRQVKIEYDALCKRSLKQILLRFKVIIDYEM